MDRDAQRLRSRIKAVVGRGRRVDPVALGELLRDWPELAGWWPGVGDPAEQAPNEELGHPEVVRALRWCQSDPGRREKFEQARQARERGRPPDLRFSRSVYQACEAVRQQAAERGERVSSSKAHETVSAQLSEYVAAWADVTGQGAERQIASWDQPTDEGDKQRWPAHLAPMLRELFRRGGRVADWVERRLDDGEGRTQEDPGNLWSVEGIRHHDEIYRRRLRTLKVLGLREVGSIVQLVPEDPRAGFPYRPLVEPGPEVTMSPTGVETVDVRVPAESVAIGSGSPSGRALSGHRRRRR